MNSVFGGGRTPESRCGTMACVSLRPNCDRSFHPMNAGRSFDLPRSKWRNLGIPLFDQQHLFRLNDITCLEATQIHAGRDGHASVIMTESITDGDSSMANLRTCSPPKNCLKSRFDDSLICRTNTIYQPGKKRE